MKLRLFPQEKAGLAILAKMATEGVSAVHTLSELLGTAPTDFEDLAEQLRTSEARSTELFVALLTNMRTSFVNPLPREDLFALGRRLNEASESLTGAAELIALHQLDRIPPRASDQLEIITRQAELTVDAMRRLDNLDDLEEYWIQVIRLSKRAQRSHRVFVSELMRDLTPAALVKYRVLADALVDVSGAYRNVAIQVGSIIVKES
ncbi:DUF47 domain-containing protein [Arthrobacter sp. 35W]|uniref:DUF47 domain-containing protein n=1 Tax=Arthrobacter sp. 35W TaxID=1132441 RepID=UPI000407D356|nr:nuclease PIN [Arthrobacter sp. 35W]